MYDEVLQFRGVLVHSVSFSLPPIFKDAYYLVSVLIARTISLHVFSHSQNLWGGGGGGGGDWTLGWEIPVSTPLYESLQAMLPIGPLCEMHWKGKWFFVKFQLLVLNIFMYTFMMMLYLIAQVYRWTLPAHSNSRHLSLDKGVSVNFLGQTTHYNSRESFVLKLQHFLFTLAGQG